MAQAGDGATAHQAVVYPTDCRTSLGLRAMSAFEILHRPPKETK